MQTQIELQCLVDTVPEISLDLSIYPAATLIYSLFFHKDLVSTLI